MSRCTESSRLPARRATARARALLALTLLLFASPLALASLGACSSESDSTSGRRVQLASRVQAESLSFANSYGWNIEVERALVSVGAVRYLEGAVVARRGDPASSPSLWSFDAVPRWLRVREALDPAVKTGVPDRRHGDAVIADRFTLIRTGSQRSPRP